MTITHPFIRQPLAIAALALGLAAIAHAADIDRADRKFIQKAAEGGMVEVELGQLAQQRAGSEQVKQFGQRMVQDHSKAGEELKQLAATKGVKLADKPGMIDEHTASKLGKLNGAEFDKEFMKHMLADHKKDVAEFQKMANSAKDADVKSFASRTLPTLQEHLQMAQTTNDAVKGTP